MRGREGQVQEEGAFRCDGGLVPHELDGLVDQVLGEVVPVLGSSRWVDRVVVVGELGVEAVGLGLEEAVVALEPPAQRPLVVRTGGRRVFGGGEVPFPDAHRVDTLIAKHFGDRRRGGCHVTATVREAGVQVGQQAHPDTVVVAAGQQRGPGG
jgi:hypothetical protein